MLEHFKILTITHRHTNLNKLGKYVIEDASQHKLEALKRMFGFGELMYLSTCNRVFYFFTSSQVLDEQFQEQFFLQVNPQLSNGSLSNLPDIVEYYDGKEALMHLFEVAASMNSLVVGEREILRQLREAYEQCKKWGLTGDDIRMAMKTAVETAKFVYSNTRIGEKPVSVVSLAIQKLLASKKPKDSRILLVGAGQTNKLVAKFLNKHGFSNVAVFNRTVEKAKALADLLNGKSFSLSELPNYEGGFDVMIVCTGATKAIIDPQLYDKLLQGETDKKLVIDLSIPNNVARETVNNFAMQYVEIEDLRQLADANISFREKEVEHGREIIIDSIYTFQQIYKERQITRALREVPSAVKEVKSHAMNNVFKKELENLDEEALDLLSRMMSYMEKRCISIPMEAAKKSITR
jgi:glutamyl-tRNA reductase